MGIEDAQIDQIITLHTDVVNEIKEERDKLKADAEKLPKVQKELNEARKDLEKQNEENPYKVKYDALKEDFDKYKNEVTAKETTAKKSKAYKQLLKDAGVSEKRIESVMKVSKGEIEKVEFDDDGKLKDSDKLVDGIKNEWSDFIEVKQDNGANTPTPPKQGKQTMTRDEIMAIKDRGERRKAIAENMEVFKEGE